MHLREATQGLAQTVPGLKTSFTNLNAGLNALAFNPSGTAEGYLFHLPWLNHNSGNLFLLQDAHGPLRRGIVLQTCETANFADALAGDPPVLQDDPRGHQPCRERGDLPVMGQRAPSTAQIAVAVAFAFSCFGLLLFLWSAFGGPVPFAPEGYRVKVPFNEATQLAVESDVRISNVSVGRVKKIELGDDEEDDTRDLALATIEIDERYAPIPEDTLAMLRQKTLLGETYVELTQGSKDAPKLEEDGTLPPAQVAESVQLDEIFRTFDEPTRIAFENWMQQAAIAFAGRGADVSATIANLEPLAEDANRLLRVLDTQEEAVQQFVKNTGVVFGALSERQGQLRGLIQNSSTVFATTARRNQDIEETFRALPTFLDESRLTLNRLETFSRDTNPLILQLRPSAKELSKVLRQTARVAPDFKGFFVGFRKLAKRSRTGLPALRTLLNTDLPPVLTQFSTFLRQVTPIITAATRYKREITVLLRATSPASPRRPSRRPRPAGQPAHYLRMANPLTPGGLRRLADPPPGR